MKSQIFPPSEKISLFVKNIFVFENTDSNAHTLLPFFADGYPGLLFHQTNHGLTVQPYKKEMPSLFLYGQTLKPIELEIKGNYQLIIFQLYPFVLKSFFHIQPHTLNDLCYDLLQLKDPDLSGLPEVLLSHEDFLPKINLMEALLYQLFLNKKQHLDFKIRQIIEQILVSKGQETILQIAEKLSLNIRTLERRFLNETGLTPKQFAKIIQFQHSLQQLTAKESKTLTDVVYDCGFADQSHFIKVFKAFTGKTPKAFIQK